MSFLQGLIIKALESLVSSLYKFGILPLIKRLQIEAALKNYGKKAEKAAEEKAE